MKILVKSQLPELMKKPIPGFYILNYGKILAGTHWAVIHVLDRHNLEFFSSFGDPPLRAIAENSKVDTVANNLKIQSNLSNNCGLYCVAFILWRSSGKDFKSFLEQFQAVESERDLFKNDRKMIGMLNTFR